MANTLQWALLLHIMASMWAYAQDDLFPTPRNTTSPLGRFVDGATRWTGPGIHSHLTKVNVLPLLVLLVALAGCMAARQLWNGLRNALRALARLLTCQGSSRGAAARSLRRGSSGGGVHVSGECASVKAKSSGGSVHVDIKNLSKDLTLESSGGGVDALIRNGKNLGLDLDLQSDRVNIDLQNFSGKAEKDRVKGAMNKGGIPVYIHASGGSVNVKFEE